MIINEVFKSEQEQLLNSIENLATYKCIDNFFDYIRKDPEEDEEWYLTLEGTFITKLNKDVNGFIKEIAKDYYDKLSKEKVIEDLIKLLDEGSSSIDYCIDCGDGSYLIDDYCTEQEAYPLIKQFMLKTLNSIIKERNEKDKERRIKALINTIDYTSNSIEDNKKRLKEAQEELEKLRAE